MIVQFSEYVTHMRREFDQRMDHDERNRIAHMPAVVSNVLWGRQLETKVAHFLIRLYARLPFVQRDIVTCYYFCLRLKKKQ